MRTSDQSSKPHWIAIAIASVVVLAALVTTRTDRLVFALMRDGIPIPSPFLALSPLALKIHALNGIKALWLAAIFFGTGFGILRLLNLETTPRLVSCCLSFGLGAGVWALLFFSLGTLGLLTSPFLWTTIAAGSLLAMASFYHGRSVLRGSSFSVSDEEQVQVLILAAPVLLLLIALIPYVFVPETFYDALEYHLGLPHLYLLEHRIGPTPDNAFAGSPSIPSMLFGWALRFDQWGIVAHVLNYFALIWAFGSVAALGMLVSDRVAGMMSVCIYASMPVVVSAGYLTTVEMWWTAFVLCSALCFFLIQREHPGSSIRRNLSVLCGFFLGCAMSTKYIAWATPAGFIGAWLFTRRKGKALSPREVLLIATCAGVTLAPWLIKNLAHYKNPIYPFFHERIAPSAEVIPGWKYLGTDTTLPLGEGALPYLKALSQQPKELLIHKSFIAQSFGPALALVVALILLLPARGDAAAALILALVSWVPFILVTRLPRYHAPAVGLVTAAACISFIDRATPGLRKTLVTATAGFSFIYVVLICSVLLPVPQRYAFSSVAFDAYLDKTDQRNLYPPPLHPVAAALKDRRDMGRILVFGDARGFQLPLPHIISTPGQATVLERIANTSQSALEMRNRLAALGVGVIVVNYAEIFRTQQPLQFSPTGIRVLTDFWARYTSKIHQAGPEYSISANRRGVERWIGVYQVLEEAEAGSSRVSDDLIKNIVAGPPASK